MDVQTQIAAVREAYLRFFREAVRAKRAEHANCTAEVWVRPNAPDGREPICVDLILDSGPAMVTTADELPEGPPLGTWRVGRLDMVVYPFAWEGCVFWMRCLPSPDWSAVTQWKSRWANP